MSAPNPSDEGLAQQLAAAERNAEQDRRRLAATAEIMEAVGSSVTDVYRVFEAIVTHAGELFDADTASVAVRDADASVMAATYSKSLGAEAWRGVRRAVSASSVQGRVLAS